MCTNLITKGVKLIPYYCQARVSMNQARSKVNSTRLLLNKGTLLIFEAQLTFPEPFRKLVKILLALYCYMQTMSI